MDLLQQTTIWVNGEVWQGKIMLAFGVVSLIAFVMIFRSQHELLRGVLIPLALALIVLIGYGGYQVAEKPSHIAKIEKIVQVDPQKAKQQESAHAKNEMQTFTLLKKVWAALIVVSVIAFFALSSPYFKGLSIGFAGFFLIALIVDSFLHRRLLVYWTYLDN